MRVEKNGNGDREKEGRVENGAGKYYNTSDDPIKREKKCEKKKKKI